MFTRARLRITILYASLMGITLLLVAGGILVLSVNEAKRNDDLQLRLRADGLARDIVRGGLTATPQSRDHHDDKDHIEQQGILDYLFPVQGGTVLPADDSTVPGLPSQEAARKAVAEQGARFDTLSLSQGQVRLYSLPVTVNGRPVAVVQVARSRYFVNTAITRLLLVVGGIGAAGLLLATTAGFWLAGRTLRPIADALRRQRDFTADASHELRTPLTLIRGNAELLQRHPDQPVGRYGDVVQDIVDESDRLGRLVNDLLTLARADSGRVQIARQDVDLSALGTALARDFEPAVAAKGLALTTDISPGVHVSGDPDRLRQLGVILLDNAVRYTDSGTVRVRVAPAGHDAILGVTDTGRGIGAEHLAHLFERFYRTDTARSVEHGGTGLGLAIARWITEAHGGRIHVTSEPGHGTTFTVSLPHRVPPSHEAPRPAASASTHS